jgi:SHS2 domain-containing protein
VSYSWVEHTAELELRIEAESEHGVFDDALSALAELLADDGGGEPVAHEVTAAAPDRAALLARWLDELVYLAETDGFIPERLTSVDLAGDRIAATVQGRRAAPRHIVKGATYHRLTFEPAASGYRATVVLDV